MLDIIFINKALESLQYFLRMQKSSETKKFENGYSRVCFPGGSVVRIRLPTQERWDEGSITGSERSLGGRNSSLLQCSCLENLMDRGAWWAIVYEVSKKSWTWPSNWAHTYHSSVSQPWFKSWGKWKVKVKFDQLCLTLCNPIDYTVHGIFQARILELVAYPFSSGSSRPRNRTGVSCIAGGFFTDWAIREAQALRNAR